MKAIFTIDVEDYFHTVEGPNVPTREEWDDLDHRVVKNTQKLLRILDDYGVKATFFILGYVAQHHPELVKEIDARGHEVASHGMYHKKVSEMTREEFAEDVAASKALLEGICGKEVIGFRSPGFSHSEDMNWMMDVLYDQGFKYDSSVFPGLRFDSGVESDELNPHWIKTTNGKLFEIPISVTPVMGKNICFFGGGYLRLFPQKLILKMVDRLESQHHTPLFYIHPREIDPKHPRFKMQPVNYFRSYVNLDTVESKIRAILSQNSFVTCGEYMHLYETDKEQLFSEDKTAGFFDGYAEGFDSIYGSKNNAFWRFINKHFRKAMLYRFQDVINACEAGADKTALDVGCGPGQYMVALAQKGLGHIHGLDFAPLMIDLAKENVAKAQVQDQCSFEVADFLTYKDDKQYDYVICMGFMDYIKEPELVIAKALELTKEKAMFSFPKSDGFLAWQRKLRYKLRCPLYLYSDAQVHKLFSGYPGWKYQIKNCDRDYFVTMERV